MTEAFPQDFGQEVDQAFDNVEHTLQQAGGKGWSEVYKVRVYMTTLNEESAGNIIRNLRKFCPDHQPLLTVVEVKSLYVPDMHIEIEVESHLA